MRKLIYTIVGGCTAITPDAYYESFETCKTRALTLRLQEGFVNTCLEEARVRGIDIHVHAVEEDKVISVCEYRALCDLFNRRDSIPGTSCEDRLLDSDVPADCAYVMIASVQDIELLPGKPVSGTFVAEALTRLVSVHASGFAVNMEHISVNFDEDANLYLNPMRLQPLMLPSGELRPGAMNRLKIDLEEFHFGLTVYCDDLSLVRDFGNWIRKIRIDRTEIPTVAEYAEWITRFSNSNVIEWTVPDSPMAETMCTPEITEFEHRISLCQERFQNVDSSERIAEGQKFTLQASGEVLTVGEAFPGGQNADVFHSSDPTLIVKLAYSLSEFCVESAALIALKGLGGRIPESVDVKDPIGCMMVMRKVGTADWPLKTDARRPSNEHIAQLIGIVRDLHEAGFVHRDFHPRNIRMDDQRVYLLDFGMAQPISVSGGHPDDTRRADMRMLVEFVIPPEVPRWLEMLADMDALGDEERPNYEKWIDFFRSSV